MKRAMKKTLASVLAFMMLCGIWLTPTVVKAQTVPEEVAVYASTRTDAGNSYLFFTTDAITGQGSSGEMEYDCTSGGVYLDGATEPSNITFVMRNGETAFFIYFGWFNYVPQVGSTIKIDGVFKHNASGHQLSMTGGVFTYDGTVWKYDDGIPPFETTVEEHSREDIGVSHMFFTTVDNDGRFAGGEMYYSAVSGGIYVNEVLYTTITFRRNGETQYFIYFQESGLPTPTDKMTLYFDGVFQSGDSKLKFGNTVNFTYWEINVT